MKEQTLYAVFWNRFFGFNLFGNHVHRLGCRLDRWRLDAVCDGRQLYQRYFYAAPYRYFRPFARRRSVRSGQNISLYQMLWPIRYTAAAVFLLSPGFISTAVALLLLIPFKGNTPVSSAQSFQSRQTYGPAKDDEDIIEGEYTVTRTGKADKPQDYIEHKPD